MPRISEFFGIAIYNHKNHAPPHFHAIYAQYDAAIGIAPLEVLWPRGRSGRKGC